MGGLLAQQAPQQAPAGGIPGLGVLPEAGPPGLGVLQTPALAGGAAARRPEDELSERARAQQVSGVFGGGGNDIIQQLIASLGGGATAPGAANVPGSIIGPDAAGVQFGAAPGGINIDPVVAAIVEAYQQMISPKPAERGQAGENRGSQISGQTPEIAPGAGPISLGTAAQGQPADSDVYQNPYL